MEMITVRDAIMSGPNRWSRIMGHATINGLDVRLRMRISGFAAVVEYTDATREDDAWHQLGGNYSPVTPLVKMLSTLPCVAQVRYTQPVSDMIEEHN